MSASQVVPKHSFRTYSDGLSKESEQSFTSWLVAVSTMTLYTGWMHILFGLFIASCFSWTARYILLALCSTLLLPTKPVLWSAFCRCGYMHVIYIHFTFATAAAAKSVLHRVQSNLKHRLRVCAHIHVHACTSCSVFHLHIAHSVI